MKPLTIVVSFDVGEQVALGGIGRWIADLVNKFGYRARGAVPTSDKPIASVGKLHILHGGEERCGFHLDRLCEPPPRARLKDVRQEIIDLALLTKPDNVAILVQGVSFSFGDSDGLVTNPDTSALLIRASPRFTHSSARSYLKSLLR
jgi:hypothetical protein